MALLLERNSFAQVDGHDTTWLPWIPGTQPKRPSETPLTPEMVELARTPGVLVKRREVIHLVTKIPNQTHFQLMESLRGPLALTQEKLDEISEGLCKKDAQKTLFYEKSPFRDIRRDIRFAADICRQRSEYTKTYLPYYIPPDFRDGARELSEEYGIKLTTGTNTPAKLESLAVGFSLRGGLWQSLNPQVAMVMRLRREGISNTWQKLSVAWLLKAMKDFEDQQTGHTQPLYVFEDSKPALMAILRDIPEAIGLCPLTEEDFYELPYQELPENLGSNKITHDRLLFQQNLFTASGLAEKRGRTYHASVGIPRAAAAQAIGTIKSFFYHVPKATDTVQKLSL